MPFSIERGRDRGRRRRPARDGRPVLALVGLVLFPLLALANHVYTTHVEEPAALVQARFGDLASVAHESFDGALVVKTLGLADHEQGRLAAAADRLRARAPPGRLPPGRLRARARHPAEPRHDRPARASAPGGCRRARSPPASWSRPWPCSPSSRCRCGCSASCSSRCRARWCPSTGSTRCIATEPAPSPIRRSAPACPPAPSGSTVADVGFAYPEGPPVLDGLRFTVRPGEVVALTGATGSGKSTLCYLLAHLMDPSQGRVEVGGVDLTVVDPDELRAVGRAGVPGDVPLRRHRAGEPHARPSRSPTPPSTGPPASPGPTSSSARSTTGRDTVIGERGVTLSGGQRQRLALARALLRHPRLLHPRRRHLRGRSRASSSRSWPGSGASST